MAQITHQITKQLSNWKKTSNCFTQTTYFDYGYDSRIEQMIEGVSTGKQSTLGIFYKIQHENSLDICLQEIPFEQGVLRRHKPLMLKAILSPCREYVDVNFQDVGMELTFSRQDNIKEGLEEILCMKWKRYAMGNPKKMTRLAQKIRKRLRDMYEYAS